VTRILCGTKEIHWAEIKLMVDFIRLSGQSNNFFAKYELMVDRKFHPVNDVDYFCELRDLGLFKPRQTRPSMRKYHASIYGAISKEQRRCAFLLDVLRYAFMKESTDPRDKVYGLLGLVSRCSSSPSASSLLRTDYELSAVDVLSQAATLFVSLIPIIDMFCLVTDRSLRRMHGLPSWVPDPTASSFTPDFASPLFVAGLTKFNVEEGYQANLAVRK
jgi:hypothetical protein